MDRIFQITILSASQGTSKSVKGYDFLFFLSLYFLPMFPWEKSGKPNLIYKYFAVLHLESLWG